MSICSLTVVGGGNGAHTIAALASARGLDTRMWVPISEEAKALQDGVKKNRGIEVIAGESSIKGEPSVISCDPVDVIPDSDLVLIVLPAYVHKELIVKLKPLITEGNIIGALPSRSGFEIMANSILPQGITIFGTHSLPWSCRIREFGKTVEIIGSKTRLSVAAAPISQTVKVNTILTELLNTEIINTSNMLSITLGNVGQILHPGIMYSYFKNWDGKPFSKEEIPFFYHGITRETCKVLEKLSQEILSVKVALEAEGKMQLDGVVSLEESLVHSYNDIIIDKTDLYSCIITNKGYSGLKTPFKDIGNNEYIPDFMNRYLTEDLPHGLVVTKSLAIMTNTKTPVIDEIISVTSKWIDKEYLIGSELIGKDVSETPVPQNYNVSDLDSLMRLIS